MINFFGWIPIVLKVFAVLWGLFIALIIVAYFTLGRFRNW